MQQHIEEFSVSDVRHTLQEVLRIAGHRRWRFVFPFCLVGATALVCSLWVPRQYTTQTVVKREHDPVFSSMMGRAWTHPYAEIKNRMLSDLQDEEAITAILEELDLPEGLERFDDGGLTPAAEARRRRLARAVAEGLSVKSLSSIKDCDVMAINLVMADAAHMEEILAAVRDHYITTAKQRTVDLLRDVEQFFRGESDRCRAELETLERQLLEYELKYPGINPDASDPGRTEQTTLVVERLELERKIDTLRTQRQGLADRLAALTRLGQDVATPEAASALLQPNPRHAELNQEITLLLKQIAESRTLRGMTDLHPTIVQLQNRVALRREELAGTPREIAMTADSVAGGDSVAAAIEDLTRQVAEADAAIAAHQSRLSAIEDTLARIEKTRIQTVEHRQDYIRLRQKEAQATAELQSWQQNIGPIERIFLVEDANRTIHFATVKGVDPVLKPSAPNALLVTLVCLGIAAAVGILVVLASELVDRSFRTAKQLKGALGIPLIESIDEILTAAVHRRRMVKRLVLMPVATAACAAALLLAGSMAYLSIERPRDYARLRSAPTRVTRVFFGQGWSSSRDSQNAAAHGPRLADVEAGS